MFLYSDLTEKYLVVTEVKQIIKIFVFNYGLQIVLSFKDGFFFPTGLIFKGAED